ncbi:hypothetical protein H4Q26_004248 [Puccinia striiformis f. sp. tritici PST-130]|nr:hypothetical protein H4Q26_004248 [Puccinia striiformis f. sp. tritici PST-130]
MFSAWNIARSYHRCRSSARRRSHSFSSASWSNYNKTGWSCEPQQCGNGFVLFSYYSDSVSTDVWKTPGQRALITATWSIAVKLVNALLQCPPLVNSVNHSPDCVYLLHNNNEIDKDNFIFKNCHRIDASDHPTKSTVTVVAAEFVADNGNGKLEAHGTPPGQKGRREYVCYWSKTDNFNNHRPWCTDCSLY